jgi:hypothetical protein
MWRYCQVGIPTTNERERGGKDRRWKMEAKKNKTASGGSPLAVIIIHIQ